MPAQSGILPPPSRHARFLVIRLVEADLAQLKVQLGLLESTRKRLHTQFPEADLVSVVGFGPALWRQLYPRVPPRLQELAPIEGKFSMPATGGDLILHIHSDRADLCFSLAQVFMQDLAGVEVMDERAAFRYLDSRDLTGFIDGTENPQTLEERAEAALLSEDCGEFAEGSFIFAQRYVHHLDKWHKLKVDAQEQVIGRSKLDSVEMSEELKPESAHIARVVIEENGEELEIVRHSLPYGDGGGEQGLFFIAYTHSPSIIDRMLESMFGTSGDGLSDRLLNFVTPVTGAYFFAPSQQLLDEVIGAD